MNIHIADPFPVQAACVNEAKRLVGFRDCRHRQMSQEFQRWFPIRHATASNLTDDVRMHQYPTAF
jgi:hypothetical protein